MTVLNLVALSLLGQVLFPPVGSAPFDFGSQVPFAYPAEKVTVAMAGSTVQAVWLDRRRSAAFPERNTPFADLWATSTASGGAMLDPSIVATGSASIELDEPRIALNGAQRVIGFVRRDAMRSAWFAERNGSITTHFGNYETVAVAPFLTGFVTARAGDPPPDAGSLDGVTLSFLGARPDRFLAPLSGITHLEVAGSPDGGVLVAAQATLPWLTNLGDAGWFGLQQPSILVGLSRSRGVLYALDTSTAQNVTRIPSGTSFSFNSSATNAVVTTTPLSEVFAYVGSTGTFVGVPGTELRIRAGTPTGIALEGFQGTVALSGTPGVLVPFDSQFGLDAGTAFEISLGATTTRTPSVAWNEASGGFIVGWLERSGPATWTSWRGVLSLDGGTHAPSNTGTSSTLPDTRVLQVSPLLAGYATTTGTTTYVGALDANGNPITPDSFQSSWTVGEGEPSFAMQQGGDYQTKLIITRGTTTGSVPLSMPRCAAALNGSVFIAGWASSNATVPSIARAFPDGGVVGPMSFGITAGNPSTQERLCLSARSVSGRLVAAWREDTRLRAVTIDPNTLTVIEGPSAVANGRVDPIAVETGDGLQFTAGGSQSLILEPPGTVIVPSNTDLGAPAMAVSPSGVLALAWHEFDPNKGAIRVHARLVLPNNPFDGGSDAGGVIGADAGLIDAGLIDAGLIDAGLIDAGLGSDAGVSDAGGGDAGVSDAGGVIDTDSGVKDAGVVPDAGVADGSIPDGGATIAFVPACSCDATPSWLLLASLTTISVLRRRRRAR